MNEKVMINLDCYIRIIKIFKIHNNLTFVYILLPFSSTNSQLYHKYVDHVNSKAIPSRKHIK